MATDTFPITIYELSLADGPTTVAKSMDEAADLVEYATGEQIKFYPSDFTEPDSSSSGDGYTVTRRTFGALSDLVHYMNVEL